MFALQLSSLKEKNKRLEMKDEYIEIYGGDPTPLMLTDLMSDLVSELEGGNLTEKHRHFTRVVMSTRKSIQAYIGKETTWEVVHLGLRSKSASTYFSLFSLGLTFLREKQ